MAMSGDIFGCHICGRGEGVAADTEWVEAGDAVTTLQYTRKYYAAKISRC